ncbi:MAG: YqgE/AlgH family protein [Actinomycetota bacterium]|nr:YqgE/AlgH family protein [Actinomycetota bacterium]
MATPLIGDPNFERTIILLLAHGEEGAFGVVLNRPSATDVAEIIPDWADAAAAPKLMFIGGPVGVNAVIGLGRPGPDDRPSSWQPLVGAIGTLDLNSSEDATSCAEVRLFAGSAGWAVGQLEDELAEGAWWLVDVDADDVFSSDPASLWSSVLRRQLGPLAWFANHPGDPSVN